MEKPYAVAALGSAINFVRVWHRQLEVLRFALQLSKLSRICWHDAKPRAKTVGLEWNVSKLVHGLVIPY
jgi:hypothetical protein